MKCYCYVNFSCFDGSCPRALYYEYGADFGFEYVTCEECGCRDGECNSCAGVFCPLDFLLAEAVPDFGLIHDIDIAPGTSCVSYIQDVELT